MVLRLPEKGRPLNVHYRQCALGVDLPASFVMTLRGLDENLYPVFHPYKMLWDSVINADSGEIEDPRYQINYNYGELNFGFVLTDGQGRPVPDGTWHVWRWCEPAVGWAHIINIDSKDTQYLNLLIKRIWLQDQYTNKYGFRGYQKVLEELDYERREKLHNDKVDLMNEISKVNSAMLRRVRDNFERGIVQPTNPQKESIISYPNQGNRSRIVRPLDDKEGGLIIPD